MPLVKIPLSAGVYKDDTPLAAVGYFVDADKIRFVRGRAQTIAGWEKAAETAFVGICRGLCSWKDNSGLSYVALGTNSAVYAFNDGVLYDITPVDSRGQLTNPFTTTLGTSTTVAHASHGRSVGDRVSFANATAVGGITISGNYTVVSVVNANSYTITTATATAAGPGGGTVDYSYYLVTGLVDSLGGAGFGTGGWSIGPFGTSAAPSYAARTHALESWGQNLLDNPRGYGIYEWSPLLITSTNLVTDGDFATAGTGTWTFGTGWSYTGSAAAGTGTTAGDLSTAIVLPAAAYFLLEADITQTAGSVDFKIGSTTIGSAASSLHTKTVFFTGSGALKFSNPGTFAGRIDNVTVKQLNNHSLLPNAPTQNTCMIVTPERIVMVGGTIDSQTVVFNPLHVRWSDQDYNVAAGLPGNQIWTATATNQAGFYTLSKGGRIVGMKNGNGEVLVWTDDALYAARYVPDPNIVYSFRLVGQGCGLIGPNAAIVAGGIAFWMSPGGEFYRYAGGSPEPLQCTCRRDVFDNLAKVQGDKVYAFSNSAWTEVWWLYPDSREGNECSRYILYDVAENVWAPGTFDRTAWLDAGAYAYAVATGTDGYLYLQEKGNSADGMPLAWSISTGSILIGDGNHLMQVNGIVHDFEDFQGGVSITFNTRLYPTDTPTTFGPYTVTASVAKTDLISIAREGTLTYSGNAAPAFMRFGTPRLDLTDTGQLY